MWLNLPANCVFTLSMSYHFIQHWPHLSHLPAATHRQLLAARQRKYKTAIEPLRNANKATHTNLSLHFIVLSASEGQTVLLYAARSVTNQETSSRLSTSSNLFFQRQEKLLSAPVCSTLNLSWVTWIHLFRLYLCCLVVKEKKLNELQPSPLLTSVRVFFF